MKPEYITDVKPRKGEWPEREIRLPPIVPPPDLNKNYKEYIAWYEEWRNFKVGKRN